MSTKALNKWNYLGPYSQKVFVGRTTLEICANSFVLAYNNGTKRNFGGVEYFGFTRCTVFEISAATLNKDRIKQMKPKLMKVKKKTQIY